MRAVKLFLVGLVGGFLLLLSSGIIYSYYNGDKIAAIAIRYVSGLLESKVTVDEVHFSVIRHFPYATLDLTNVCALSKSGFKLNVTDSIQSDTLLKTKHLYLKFDLFELLHHNFKLSRIEISEGILYLLINNASDDNFDIIKKSKEETKSNFSIDITKLELNKCQLYLINENKKLYLSSWISKSSISGKFFNDSLELQSELKSKINQLKIDGVSYCRNIPLSLSLDANSNHNKYSIRKGELSYADLPLSVSGNFSVEKSLKLNIALHAKKLDINKLKNHLSVFLGIPTTISDLQGKLSVDAKITGILDKTSIPSVNSYFEWTKGEIELILHKQKHRLTKLNVIANYSNGLYRNSKSSTIQLDVKNIAFENSTVLGKILLSNFIKPTIETTFSSSVQLIDINKFINSSDTLNFKSGTVQANGGFSGKLDSLVVDIPKTLFLKGEIKNVGCDLFNKSYNVEFANGNFVFDNELKLSNLSANFNTMPVKFTGTINGFRRWIFGQHSFLTIEGTTAWEWFDVSAFSSDKKKENNKQGLAFSFPENVGFALDFSIHKFKMASFLADEVTGNVRYKPKTFIINDLKFNSMTGKILANGTIAQQGNGDLSVRLQSQLNQLNINDMFHAFNNFGQKVLLPQHLKGTLTGSINFSADWDKNLNVYDDRIVADAKFEISKGELIDFKPLEGLSKFISVSELKHIYFSTLKNQIFIKNKIITIPQMDISSSALNLQVSGTHSFQNQYDYHVRVALSEILFRKARDAKKEVSDNAEEEKDKGAKLYLTIKGEGDNYKVKFDSKSSRKAFVETLSTERKTISNLLKKEFGTSNDSTQTTKSKKAFKIDWEENKQKIEKEPVKKEPTKESKKQPFKIEWDN